MIGNMIELPPSPELQLPITAVAAGVLGVMIITLALNVSLQRMRFKVSLGDGGHPQLRCAIRAHGNNAEHVPLFLVLCLLLELTGGGLWLAIVATSYVLGRVLYTWGMLRRDLSVRRRIGTALSYLLSASMALVLLARVFL